MEQDVNTVDRFERLTYFKQTWFTSGDRKGQMKENFITLRQTVNIWHDSQRVDFGIPEFHVKNDSDEYQPYDRIKDESFTKAYGVQLNSPGLEGVSATLPGFVNSVFTQVKQNSKNK